MRNTFALLTILLLGSCLSPDSVNTEHGYYDLSGLIYDQVLRLDSLGFDLQKDAWFEDRTDTDHFTMDSSRWAQELKLFAEADLNSPVLEGLYRVKDSIRDSGSNLMIRRLKLPHLVRHPCRKWNCIITGRSPTSGE